MTKDVQRLTLKYNAYTSGQSYIVVNTTENRFYLYTNKKLIREGFCSTGSLTMLKTEKGTNSGFLKHQGEKGQYMEKLQILPGTDPTGHLLKRDYLFLQRIPFKI